MPNFQYVGQADSSGDCGYFCGYVLRLMILTSATPSRMEMTQEDVYRAREAYLRRVPPSVRPSPLTHSLGIHAVPAYLNSLGVVGYATQPVAGGYPLQTVPDIIRTVVESVRRPNSHGIIVPMGSAAGHYVAILAGSEQRWLIYDPAGTIIDDRRFFYAVQQAAEVAPRILRSHVTHIVRPA